MRNRSLSTQLHKYDDVYRSRTRATGVARSRLTMPRNSPYIVHIGPADRKVLEGMARKYTSPYKDVIRAKIVLYAAAGLQNHDIAARLDLARQIVSKWRKRFFEEGLAGLEERARRGRPARFSPQYRRRD
jgi:hypothetical protein